MNNKMIKILFYDPETNVLSGLRRFFHTMRSQWEMTFTSDQQEALKRIQEDCPTVLVADVSDQNGSGLELLRFAKEQMSECIRIGISASLDESVSIQAIYPTHRFLAKPFDGNELKAVIERALAMRERIDNNHLLKIISRIDQLPSPPEIYLQINQALAEENVSVNHIAELIKNDPNMTAQILKIVNSAYFGLFDNIDSVQRAIILLGFDLIKNLVLSIHLFRGIQLSGKETELVEQIGSHSTNVAMATMEIVKRSQEFHRLSQLAFSVGILHDVGKLIFLQAFGDEYFSLWQKAGEEGAPLWKLEQQKYGLTHADTGAYLLGLWGLPEHLVQHVAASHSSQTEHYPSDFLLRVLRTVDAVEIAVARNQEPEIPDDLADLEQIREWIKISHNLFTGSDKND